jgi:hypothetical protein
MGIGTAPQHRCKNAGGAVATRMPPPTPPVSVSPGYHYYQMHMGIAYFVKLSTGEKVNLGPIESASSFVTLTVNTERMVTVKMERVTVEIETTKRKAAGNDEVVDLSQNMTKKSRPACRG